MIAQETTSAMHQPVCFDVVGQAVPWSRAGRKGGFSYTPPQVRHYQNGVKDAAVAAMAGRNPLLCPLDLFLEFFLEVPRSWPQWRQQAALSGHVRPAGKPDLDNLIKVIKDACNSIVYRDDSQIVEIRARKRYGSKPSVVVIVGPTAGLITSAADWRQRLEIPALEPTRADLFAGGAA